MLDSIKRERRERKEKKKTIKTYQNSDNDTISTIEKSSTETKVGHMSSPKTSEFRHLETARVVHFVYRL
jgi:hypothetical protein